MREVDPDHASTPSEIAAVYYYAVTVLLNLGVDYDDPTATIALYLDGAEYCLVINHSMSQHIIPCKWIAVEELKTKIPVTRDPRVKSGIFYELHPYHFRDADEKLVDG